MAKTTVDLRDDVEDLGENAEKYLGRARPPCTSAPSDLPGETVFWDNALDDGDRQPTRFHRHSRPG